MKKVTAAIVLVLAACGGGGGTGPAPDPSDALIGMWTMVAINGAPPPFIEEDSPSSRWEITGGTMRFAPGVSGSELRYCRRYSGSHYPEPRLEANDDDFGWEIEGENVTINFFRPAYLDTNFATLIGGDLVLQRTFEVPDRSYTFRKIADAPGTMPGCM